MGKFLLGVIFTLVVLALIVLGVAMLGLAPTTANVEPPHWERHLAMSAVDNSMDRHAPRVSNPLTPTDSNLEDGMKLYTMNCALCHGGLDRKPSTLANSFYPPPPNLVSDPPDDPEWHIFYTIRTGVRYTGMPAWDKSSHRTGHVEDRHLPFPHGQTPARRTGILEGELHRYSRRRRTATRREGPEERRKREARSPLSRRIKRSLSDVPDRRPDRGRAVLQAVQVRSERWGFSPPPPTRYNIRLPPSRF